jgi:ribonuclease-3
MEEKETTEESAEAFAQRIGLGFNDRFLLMRALTHRSYLNEHPEALEQNERLEFLGDAILDFLVGEWLYQRFPEMPEGDLTRMRSALVQTESLAAFARQIDLGRALRLGRGEAHSGARQRSPILCDAFEALVGAIYLDQGLGAVKSFIEPFMTQATEVLLTSKGLMDSKSRLQEWSQGRGFPAPQYETKDIHGPDHARVFEVEVKVQGKLLGVGQGPNKQAASKAAAADALRHIQSDAA